MASLRDPADAAPGVKDSCSSTWLPGTAASMDMHSEFSPPASPA